jgi:hypothetical protein
MNCDVYNLSSPHILAGEVPPDGTSFKRLPSKHRTAAHPDAAQQHTPPAGMVLSDSEVTDVNSGDDGNDDDDDEIDSDDDRMVPKGPYMGSVQPTAAGMPAMGPASSTVPVGAVQGSTAEEGDRYPAVKPAGVFDQAGLVQQGGMTHTQQQAGVPISADGTYAGQQAGQQYPGVYLQQGAAVPAVQGMQYTACGQQYVGGTLPVLSQPVQPGQAPGYPQQLQQQPPPPPMLDRDDPNAASMMHSGDGPDLGNLALFGGVRDEVSSCFG